MADINPSTAMHNRPLETVLEAALVDLTMLKAAHATLIAKLNLDAGITDTDYAEAGALTLTNA